MPDLPNKRACIFDGNSGRAGDMASRLPSEFFSYWATDELQKLADQLETTDIILAHDSNTKLSEIKEIMREKGVFVPLCGYSRYPKVSKMVAQIKAGALDYFLLPPEDDFAERLLLACGEGKRLFDHHPKAPKAMKEDKVAIDSLTRRELEIAQYLAKGLTSSQIGSTLGIKRATVDVHAMSVYRKLGLSNRLELVKAKPTLFG